MMLPCQRKEDDGNQKGGELLQSPPEFYINIHSGFHIPDFFISEGIL
jgi:hypothetical protein